MIILILKKLIVKMINRLSNDHETKVDFLCAKKAYIFLDFQKSISPWRCQLIYVRVGIPKDSFLSSSTVMIAACALDMSVELPSAGGPVRAVGSDVTICVDLNSTTSTPCSSGSNDV